MKETKWLRFRPGVTLVESGAKVGICLGEHTRWAQNGEQAAILRALSSHALDLDTLCGDNSQTPAGAQIALALASVILDFGDYLEP